MCARKLRNASLEYLRAQADDCPPDLKVIVQVYANFKGLAKLYHQLKVIADLSDFEVFVRGFNKEDPLCNMIDAGDGKECCDEKLKGEPGPESPLGTSNMVSSYFPHGYGQSALSAYHLWWLGG